MARKKKKEEEEIGAGQMEPLQCCDEDDDGFSD